MAIRHLSVLIVLLFCIACGASAPGRLYTNTISPYSTDFTRTPVGTKQTKLDEHSLKEPFSGRGISVEWSTGRIQEAARKEGITRITFIDQQTVSILFGIYKRRRLIIYGN